MSSEPVTDEMVEGLRKEVEALNAFVADAPKPPAKPPAKTARVKRRTLEFGAHKAHLKRRKTAKAARKRNR